MWFNGFSGILDIRPFAWRWCGCLALIGAVAAAGSAAAFDGLVGTIAAAGIGAFTTLLVIRQARHRVLRVQMLAGGGWQLTCASGARIAAQLRGAWLGGRVAGLEWRGSDGLTYRCLLTSADCGTVNWRRLRVRLRLPISAAMA